MSQSEFEGMISTDRVQESWLNGVTSVTSPPNSTFWKAANADSRFVTFDIPRSALRGYDGTVGKIYGPNSIQGKLYDIREMPFAFDIREGGSQ